MAEANQRTIMWRKHTDSAGAGCVEVGADTDAMLVRDSKDPQGPVITLRAGGWPRFLSAVRNDQLNVVHSA
jgi:hypothetical protein